MSNFHLLNLSAWNRRIVQMGHPFYPWQLGEDQICCSTSGRTQPLLRVQRSRLSELVVHGAGRLPRVFAPKR